MIKNNIKSFRTRLGFTQRQLAEAAGTSQQQVQRIEAGVQAARLDLAERLAGALQCSLRDLFPELNKIPTVRRSANQEAQASALAKAGIELGQTLYRVAFRLQGGHTFVFIVSQPEAIRIRDNVISDEAHGFFVFDTPSERIAINREALIFSHFLFDPFTTADDKTDEQPSEEGLKVWLRDGGAPVTFSLDYDNKDDEEDIGQIESIFLDLDIRSRDDGPIKFEDCNGEEVVIVPAHCALFSIPLQLVCRSLLDAQLDGSTEDDDARR